MLNNWLVKFAIVPILIWIDPKEVVALVSLLDIKTATLTMALPIIPILPIEPVIERLGKVVVVAPCTVTEPTDNVADTEANAIVTLVLPSLEKESSLNDSTPNVILFPLF